MGAGSGEQGERGKRGEQGEQGKLKKYFLPCLPCPRPLILLIFIAPLENFPYFSLLLAKFIFRTIFLHSALTADAQNQKHSSDRS